MRDILPNIVSKLVEGLDYATQSEVEAQVVEEMVAWEHRSERPLMEYTLQRWFRMTRNARVFASQIPENPATGTLPFELYRKGLRDRGDQIGRRGRVGDTQKTCLFTDAPPCIHTQVSYGVPFEPPEAKL